tara:strand:+ start:192 stop:335 length:144 start_codon:yes stop_codon:yes gene_type:complete
VCIIYLHGAPQGAQDGPASPGAATIPDVWLVKWSIKINPKINAIIKK